jgi:phosphatidylserine/phosphatidylglycerophosphate/cardiolipin synthase-like enzyme
MTFSSVAAPLCRTDLSGCKPCAAPGGLSDVLPIRTVELGVASSLLYSRAGIEAMKLIVQPDAGIAPLLQAIKQAKKSIDILIFRLDRKDMVDALQSAVVRGVAVRALIAHTNRGGEESLRKLEMRLLDAGLTVTRTAGDLVRYHGKMMIVDQRVLHLYGFNFTGLDIRRSRSFGITTRNQALVREALKLFEADSARHPYTAGSVRLIVSPENARERLAAFIAGARGQLLIYDPQVSDATMVRLLVERAKAGVDVRIIGKLSDKKRGQLLVERYPGKRLHVRVIIRDGRGAFLGSQSLRRLELDKRREVGAIITDAAVVKQMQKVFEGDWSETESGRESAKAPAEHNSKAPAALTAAAS